MGFLKIDIVVVLCRTKVFLKGLDVKIECSNLTTGIPCRQDRSVKRLFADVEW